MTNTTITRSQAEAVLASVVEWMGGNGWGTPICPDGHTLGGISGFTHPDGTFCDTREFGPAPTGQAAADDARGPVLVMDYDGTPTIILEGGPEDWAIRCTFDVQAHMDALGAKVFVEPLASYALCIYPN